MPVQVSYAGVYVEEVSSGVRTITGVATSVIAFIGRAKRGPDNEAVVIDSYGLYSNKGTKTLIGCSQFTVIQGFSIFSQSVPFRPRLSWASRDGER
jgi:phage tail sheath protein FI